MNTRNSPFISTMTVFAGTNGAGKSTISRELADRVGVVVDAEAIAKELNPENPESAIVSAGREALRRIGHCISEKCNFSLETTLSGKYALQQMLNAKEQGFQVSLFYVGLDDVELHVLRVAERVRKGGHYIAEEDIRRRYIRSLTHLGQAIALADQTNIIDNTQVLRNILKIEKGQIRYRSKDIPSWVIRHVLPLLTQS